MATVLYEKKGYIAYITLNRPETYNAINLETWENLTKAWISVRDDPEVRVAIVTGAGDKAFSAGQDLKEMAQWMAAPADQRAPSLIPAISPVRGLEVWKPFIAAISGICTGAGSELAMTCDIRIAAENARFGQREVQQAVMPTGGGTQRLPRLVPLAKAMEILLTGEFIDAQEAYRIGLVNKVVPQAKLITTAEEIANRIAENGPLAVKAVKEVALRGLQMSLNDGLHLELNYSNYIATSYDSQEGATAFAQKRKPEFKGR